MITLKCDTGLLHWPQVAHPQLEDYYKSLRLCNRSLDTRSAHIYNRRELEPECRALQIKYEAPVRSK